ncbi:MAG: hypothetical protein ABIH83_01100 [Candidatus Micrarchaeota archaeon]
MEDIKKTALLFAILAAIALFASGCTQQPNTNLSYADCCQYSEKNYECFMVMEGDEPKRDGDGRIELSECGICERWDDSSGLLYDNAGNILLDKKKIPITPAECENNCNFQKADCTNEDESGNCYLVENNKINQDVVVAPICRVAPGDPCTQNECSAMICSEQKPRVRLATNEQGLNAMAEKGSSASKDVDDVGGLKGMMCTFDKMSSKTTRLLKKGDGFINSFRLGISGSFSDYEQARFYFPPSDFYCGKLGERAVVDRFVNYLDDGKVLPPFRGGNFMAKLHYCQRDGEKDADDSYWYCTNPPELSGLKFIVGEYASDEAAEYACANICNYWQGKTCENNNELYTIDINIAPPGADENIEKFVDYTRYYSLLEKAYPIPDALDYYHIMPPLDAGEEDMAAELLKPGPAGARVFECTESTDCMSNICKKDEFSTTACFDKNTGERLDCGCRLIYDCDFAYLCDQLYKKRTVKWTTCYKLRNELCAYRIGEGYVLACEYNAVDNRKEFSALNDFGVITLEDDKIRTGEFWEFEQTKDEPLEIGIMQMLGKKERCYNKNLDPQWKDKKEGRCPSGYEKEFYYKWVNDPTSVRGCVDAEGGFRACIEEHWGASFAPVPYEQIIIDTYGGGTSFYTAPDITFEQLKQRMPVIDACEMQYGTDVIESETNEGTLEEALKNSGGYPQDENAKRINKMWRLNRQGENSGFGKCMRSGKGDYDMPSVLEYGVCEPCGTTLSLAFQKITTHDKSYCPTTCNTVFPMCLCDDEVEEPRAHFIYLHETAPKTYPEYGFISSKIDEYMAAGIMPVLDIKEYEITTSALGLDKYTRYWDADGEGREWCENMGGEWEEEGNFLDYSDSCTWEIGLGGDYFLKGLADGRSASILIVDDLEGVETKQRISNVRSQCPDCMLALEIKLEEGEVQKAMEDGTYPQRVSDIIREFSEEKEYDEYRFSDPWGGMPKPPQIADVDILVLNMNLEGASFGNKEKLDKEVKNLVNMSRKILQHVGWKTLWKFEGNEKAYKHQEFYKTLWANEYEMSLYGVVGILLPPMDELIYGKDIKDAESAFCAAEEGSTEFLHPENVVALQQIYPREGCQCNPCTETEIKLDQCKESARLCLDGMPCKSYNEVSGEWDLPPSGKCQDACIRADGDYMKKCEDVQLEVTCRAMRSDNELLRLCSGAQDLPECDIITFKISELVTNPFLSPYRAEFIGGLPAKERCYIEEEDAKFSYRLQISARSFSEPMIYPTYGANTTECSRLKLTDEDVDTCNWDYRIPLPIRKTAWTCTISG